MATMSHRKSKEGVKIIRTTKEGRTLQYELNVLQQPERARACGSGAKSSADRRPVDPPPVVELHINQLVEGEPPKDVTFSYDANFFLFATLENARPIAHGRGQPPAASIPVLTGMPVSGMAYLDRPKEAGYFIFPDLSVRHEGKYKLSFNLYEQTRFDKDTNAEPSDKQGMPSGASPDSSFDWRLEVKSDPFTVYSAKKFPGLAESTLLSRTVAEQGCRVRIRRDVRMRRRDGKMGNQDYDEHEMAYERPGAGHSAYDADRQRTRSISGTPNPHSPIDGRRGSGEFLPPHPHGHLNFGHSESYAAPPPASFAQPPHPTPQPQYHQPGPVPFQHPAPEYRPPPPSAPQQSYPYGERPPYPQSAHPSTHPPRDYPVPEYRRASEAGHASASRSYDPLPPRLPFSSGYAPLSPRLPSLKLDSRYDTQPSTTGPLSISRLVPAPSSPVHERGSDAYPAPSYMASNTSAPAPRKRGYDQGFPFSASRQNEPLHNHQRPETAHPDQAALDDAADEEPTIGAMNYKRADGMFHSRPAPEIIQN